MNRGDHSDAIFLDDTDHLCFLRTLSEACENTGRQVQVSRRVSVNDNVLFFVDNYIRRSAVTLVIPSKFLTYRPSPHRLTRPLPQPSLRFSLCFPSKTGRSKHSPKFQNKSAFSERSMLPLLSAPGGMAGGPKENGPAPGHVPTRHRPQKMQSFCTVRRLSKTASSSKEHFARKPRIARRSCLTHQVSRTPPLHRSINPLIH